MLRRGLACVLVISVLWQRTTSAHAICRVVEPVEETGGVWFDPNTMALYVIASGQDVGHACMTPDAGSAMPRDGGDGDGGADDDAGRGDEDGGVGASADGAVPDCAPAQSTRVYGTVIHMVVQPAVLGGGGRAGLVMPVPARPDIHAANADLFQQLGLRLEPAVETRTEYVEDAALGNQCSDPKFVSSGGSGGGCGGGSDDDVTYEEPDDFGPIGDESADYYDPETEAGDLDRVMIGDGVVRFEEALTTDDYDVTVLNATTLDALRGWMDQNGFAHDAEDDAAFASYVSEGAWFVALDVHPPYRGSAGGSLAPLVVSWRGDRVPVLHELQFHRRGGELTTEAFVMAASRMEAEDGSAHTLYAAPAGFGGAISGFGLAQGWLTQLRFTRRLDEWKEDSFLRVSSGGDLRPVIERLQRIRIPLSTCPETTASDDDGGGCASGGAGRGDGCMCSASRGDGGVAGTFAPTLLACAWLAWRGRKRRG